MGAAVPEDQALPDVALETRGINLSSRRGGVGPEEKNLFTVFFFGMDRSRSVTGLTRNAGRRATGISLFAVNVFQIGFVLFFVTLRAAFKPCVITIPIAAPGNDDRKKKQDDCEEKGAGIVPDH